MAVHGFDRARGRVRRIERDAANTNQPNDFDAAAGGGSAARADRTHFDTRPAQ